MALLERSATPGRDLVIAGREARLELEMWKLFGGLNVDQRQEVIDDLKLRLWSAGYTEHKERDQWHGT